jgi:hypothetical protein
VILIAAVAVAGNAHCVDANNIFGTRSEQCVVSIDSKMLVVVKSNAEVLYMQLRTGSGQQRSHRCQ